MDIRSLRIPDRHHLTEYTVPNATVSFTLWLEFEWWEPQFDDAPETNFFTMQIRLSDGRRYALNVWTYHYLSVARQDDLTTGDNLHGAYLLPPDLFVTKLDRSHMAAVIMDLIQRNHLREEWRVPEEAADEARDNAGIDGDAEDSIFVQLIEQMRIEGRIIECDTDTPAD
jgi:hypothetical protein